MTDDGTAIAADEGHRDHAEEIGFVGVGNMGLPMVDRLILNGVPVAALSRSDDGRTALEDRGARAARTPRELAQCEVIFCMLPDLPDVRSVLWGDGGLVDGWRELRFPKRTLVVMSSVSPVGVIELGAALSAESDGAIHVVDAPVSGGIVGAETGRLSIMVGATPPDFEYLTHFFTMMGGVVRLMGPLGSGSLAKACNQIVVAATATALSEALVLAERGGLDLAALLDLFEGGVANSTLLGDVRERLLTRDYRARASARSMRKDLNSFREAAASESMDAPLALAVERVFIDVVAQGMGDQDVMVVRELISRLGPPSKVET